MNLTCNIDQRGARARRIWGGLNLLAAALLAFYAWFFGPWWLWIIAALCTAAALFAFYEARKKWCIMRAMGLKTPL